MSDDFFGDLGKSISRATQRAVDQTSSFFESTKILTQITSEKKEIEKLYGKIGERVARKIEKNETDYVGDEERSIVDEIKSRRGTIHTLRQSLADVKNMRICPNCEELIEKTAAFCPKCGAPVPADDEEEFETPDPDEELSSAKKPMAEEKEEEGILDASFDTVEDLSAVVEDVMDAGFTTIDDTSGAAEAAEEAEFVVLEGKPAPAAETESEEAANPEPAETPNSDEESKEG